MKPIYSTMVNGRGTWCVLGPPGAGCVHMTGNKFEAIRMRDELDKAFRLGAASMCRARGRSRPHGRRGARREDAARRDRGWAMSKIPDGHECMVIRIVWKDGRPQATSELTMQHTTSHQVGRVIGSAAEMVTAQIQRTVELVGHEGAHEVKALRAGFDQSLHATKETHASGYVHKEKGGDR